MKPITPTNIQASDGTYSNGILVSWDYSGNLSDIGRWDIYRWSNGEYPTFYYSYFGNSTSFLDTLNFLSHKTPDIYSTYHYAVVAYSYDSGSSDISQSDTGFISGLRLTGTTRNDTLIGGDGADIISGLSGNDCLWGGNGPDLISGDGGNDIIYGGLGQDTLSGGSGKNKFVFSSVRDSNNYVLGADVITDFVHGKDRIDLSAIDAFSPTQKNDSFKFTGTKLASGIHSSGEVGYAFSNGNTIIYIDNDAWNSSESIIVLTGYVRLTASDFIL